MYRKKITAIRLNTGIIYPYIVIWRKSEIDYKPHTYNINRFEAGFNYLRFERGMNMIKKLYLRKYDCPAPVPGG